MIPASDLQIHEACLLTPGASILLTLSDRYNSEMSLQVANTRASYSQATTSNMFPSSLTSTTTHSQSSPIPTSHLAHLEPLHHNTLKLQQSKRPPPLQATVPRTRHPPKTRDRNVDDLLSRNSAIWCDMTGAARPLPGKKACFSATD